MSVLILSSDRAGAGPLMTVTIACSPASSLSNRGLLTLLNLDFHNPAGDCGELAQKTGSEERGSCYNTPRSSAEEEGGCVQYSKGTWTGTCLWDPPDPRMSLSCWGTNLCPEGLHYRHQGRLGPISPSHQSPSDQSSLARKFSQPRAQSTSQSG